MPADDDALGAPREEGPGADEAVRPASEVDADARALASVVRRSFEHNAMERPPA